MKQLHFLENAKLSDLTTIKIGLATARYLVKITDREQVPELYKFARQQNLPVLVLGEGSNSIATDEPLSAIVALNKIRGRGKDVISQDEIIYTLGGGEIMDSAIDWMLQDGLGGIESLSGIPGTAGSAPIQNVGAYGQELSETLVDLEAFDSKELCFVTLTNNDCRFGYRNGLFKQEGKNRYFITSIRLHLTRQKIPQPPFYTSLQKYIDEHQITDFRPIKMREYILAVRAMKIPNYRQVPSAGSMFQNAIITSKQLLKIETQHGKIPFAEPIDNKFKIPTGWLIDKAGLKGKIFHGMQVDSNNALILINKSATTFSEFQAAISEIKRIVKTKFDVEIELEPIILTI
ncbi:MAG: UDP-N-acetylmuramate dehydrogenase [Candidatus Saccharibacteria bacterium]|nr:UDP-N-acetylmuramate dehydrogenase [Candidatus Saccharibacteria bacterium]